MQQDIFVFAFLRIRAKSSKQKKKEMAKSHMSVSMQLQQEADDDKIVNVRIEQDLMFMKSANDLSTALPIMRVINRYRKKGWTLQGAINYDAKYFSFNATMINNPQ